MSYMDKPAIIDILMGIDNSESFKHYGIKRRSGRYPWGSGEDPYQRSGDFVSRYDELKNKGMKDSEIAAELKMFTKRNGKVVPDTGKLKDQIALAKNDQTLLKMETANSLAADGLGATEIGRKMGLNESTVRGYLDEEKQRKAMAYNETIEAIKAVVDEKGMVDVGKNVNESLRITETRFNTALTGLEREGYHIYQRRDKQATGLGFTTVKVLTTPDKEYKDIYDLDKVSSFDDYTSDDGGKTLRPSFVYPKSMDSKRIMVRYADEGGLEKDGTVEIRPNVEDLNLGGSHYSQVRVLVDGTHYVKGMAVYGKEEDFPPGVDMIFNTNKKTGVPLLSDDPNAKQVLKPIHTEKGYENNPFGSLIKPGVKDPTDSEAPTDGGQSYYIDKNGKKQLSLINKRSDEGDWDEWKKSLPAQFLSKQNQKLINRQLTLSKEARQQEFEEYKNLSNPVVKQYFLEKFAKTCDSKAYHLDAAALPRQKYQVILPLTSLKENEIYAPNFNNGEKVALVRFPHGCINEIPILTVNNKNKEGKDVITPNAKDAVGIKQATAERLSGADFDGDTVLCIPLSSSVNISSKKPLKDMIGFDNKAEYPERKGMKYMTKQEMQKQMGIVSNLLTDMNLQGAPPEELARALKHSMVVIDAYKHKLDYKLSEKRNGIKELTEKYQTHRKLDGTITKTGAATIVSRAKGEYRIPKVMGDAVIDPNTGKAIRKANPNRFQPEYERDPKTKKIIYDENHKPVPKRDKDGNIVMKELTTKVHQMDVVDDARTLIRDVSLGKKTGHPTEEAYADYANKLKSLGNQARKEYKYGTPNLVFNKEAAIKYKDQVEYLNAQYRLCKLNNPKERIANAKAQANMKKWKEQDPDLVNDKERIRKLEQTEMTRAREEVGAKSMKIKMTDEAWKAIQEGAIHHTTLKQMLRYCDMDDLRQRAMPKANKTLSAAKVSRIKAMAAAGISTAEIAEALGVSTATIRNHLD